MKVLVKTKKIFSRLRRFISSPFRKKLSAEDKFLAVWTKTLTEKAGTFRGLYTSLRRISEGKSKKKQRVIHEWYKRTEYNIDDEETVKLSAEILLPLTKEGTDEDFAKWADLLLKAAENAGISQDAEGILTLDGSNTNAYAEWSGEPLYLGDKIEVTVGAWYQSGEIIDQGFCNKLDEAEESDEQT